MVCRRRERPVLREWFGGPSRRMVSAVELREGICVSGTFVGGLRSFRNGWRSKGMGASLLARVRAGRDGCADGLVLSCSFEALTVRPLRCWEIKEGCVEDRCECDFMARSDRFSGDSGSLIMAGSSWEGAKREVAMVAGVVAEATEGASEREGVMVVRSASVFSSHLISTDEAAGNAFFEVKPSHFYPTAIATRDPLPAIRACQPGSRPRHVTGSSHSSTKLPRPDVTFFIMTDAEATWHPTSHTTSSRRWQERSECIFDVSLSIRNCCKCSLA